MNRRNIENLIIAAYSVQDAVDAASKIAKIACFGFIVWFASSYVNVLFAIVLFFLIPCVVGLFWAMMYREAFDSGKLTLEQLESDDDDEDDENNDNDHFFDEGMM